MQSQRQLQGSRSACLIEGIQATELRVLRILSLPKQRAIIQQLVVDGSEDRMVENIERFGAEEKTNFICKSKILPQGKIGLYRIEPPGCIPACISFADGQTGRRIRTVRYECMAVNHSSSGR